MRIIAASGLVVVMAFGAPAFGQSFVGAWTATATTPGGEVSETVTVVEADGGYAVDAKLDQPQPGQPEAGPGTDIVLDGDSFSYKRTVGMPGGGIEIVYSGVVSGDTFTGTATMMGMTIPYNGVRKDAE